jgi:hypothetical protein
VQIGVQVSPEIKARLEEEATRNQRSLSREAEFRLALSFDRTQLLPEVLALAFDRHVAGLLMALGYTMHDAAINAARARDLYVVGDWPLEAHTYSAARHAAEALLSLWKPTRVLARDAHTEAGVRMSRDQGLTAAAEFVAWLEMSMMKAPPPVTTVYRDIAELLGPIAQGMIEEIKNTEEMHIKAEELKQRVESVAKRRKAEGAIKRPA